MKLIFKILFLLSLYTQLGWGQITIMDNDSLYQKVKKEITQLDNRNTLTTILNQIDTYNDTSVKKAQWYVLAGDLFRKNNELEKALRYYKKSYTINTGLSDSLALILDHVKIGIIYHKKLNISSK